MSEAIITGEYFDDYLVKKQDWRSRLLDFSIDIDPTLPDANEEKRVAVPTLTAVNGRNWRRAVMRNIAREQAAESIKDDNNLDCTPIVLGRGDAGKGHLSTNRCPPNPRLCTSSACKKTETLNMGNKTTDKLLKNIKKSTNLLNLQSGREYVSDCSYFYEQFHKRYVEDKESPDSLPDFCGGFDGGFEISFYGDWFKDSDDPSFEWGGLCVLLDGLKEKAQNNRGDFVALPIGEEKWQVMPTGSGTGVKYKWLLKRGGASISIHSNPKGNIAPVHVKLEYEALYGEAIDRVMAKIETVLVILGFHIDRDVVSRVDLQVTLVQDFRAVCRTHYEDRFITRLNKPNISGSYNQLEFETITWGNRKNRKVQICIYNKFREAFKNVYCPEIGQKAADLLEILGPKVGGYFGKGICYNNNYDNMLTRVEFRLFRDFLRLRNIESLYDLLEFMPNLIKYLTEEYFRAAKTSRDENTHYYASGYDDWWEKVIHAFNEVFVAGRSFVTKRDRRVSVVAIESILNQGCGCLTSALSQVPFLNDKGENVMFPYSKFAEMIYSIVEHRMPDLYKEYGIKRKQFLGNLEPLDMTSVKDNAARKMAAKEQREERLAKQKELEQAMLKKYCVVRSDVRDRDYDGCDEALNRVEEWISISEWNQRYGRD